MRPSSPCISKVSAWTARAAIVLIGACVASCASYQAKPLPTQAASTSSLSQLRGYTTGEQPLDSQAVQRLVLLNNPDLRSLQARHDAAQAQRRQDSVLPNPVISGSAGQLLSGVGDATAWTASISEDITALITLRPRREAARASADAVDAGLLWEQWQILGKAQWLVIDLVEEGRLIQLQQQALDALVLRESCIIHAMAVGDMDRVSIEPDLAATADARTALDDLQRRRLDQQQQLAALLGLKPDVMVPLATPLPAVKLDAASIREQADSVSRRRPDLVALQLGYQAQEATLRAAVLAQFPPLSFGYAASQDNSRVRNGGPAVTFALPLFEHNQGNVAVAKATREQLRIEYTTRMVAAHDEVDALLAQYAQLHEQWQALVPAANDAARAAARADQASHTGLLDLRNQVDLEVAAIHRQMAVIATEQAMREQQAALELLVGRGMPTSLPQDLIAP